MYVVQNFFVWVGAEGNVSTVWKSVSEWADVEYESRGRVGLQLDIP